MAIYSNDYLMDFAQRTKDNLYFIKNEVERQRTNGIKEEELTVFEVTQLIYSFVGFVMFPKQKYFDFLDPKVEFSTEDSKKVFEKICDNPKKYHYYSSYKKYDENTRDYIMNENEELTAKTLILHFRNAVGHDNLSVIPKESRKTNKIEAFIIQDQKKYRGTVMKFSVRIPVEDLEDLIIGMCDLLLAHNPKGSKKHERIF